MSEKKHENEHEKHDKPDKHEKDPHAGTAEEAAPTPGETRPPLFPAGPEPPK